MIITSFPKFSDFTEIFDTLPSALGNGVLPIFWLWEHLEYKYPYPSWIL